jgi:L-rhamnose 1-dehydrogenase
MRLENKVAIVTGAARGIGRAVALRLAREGANVAVVDVRDDEGVRTARDVESSGRRGLFVRTDVTDPIQVIGMVQATLDAFGTVDILVNDAGICPFKPFLEISPQLWDEVLETNLKGYFLCSQAVARVMVERRIKGRIINISSISSIIGGEEQAHYCSSKGAINQLTKSMAISLGPYGITCNAVLPGTVKTDINREALADEALSRALIQRTPLRRLGEPDDVAGPVVFLASDDAAYCTATMLVVDGGAIVTYQ